MVCIEKTAEITHLAVPATYAGVAIAAIAAIALATESRRQVVKGIVGAHSSAGHVWVRRRVVALDGRNQCQTEGKKSGVRKKCVFTTSVSGCSNSSTCCTAEVSSPWRVRCMHVSLKESAKRERVEALDLLEPILLVKPFDNQ